MGSYGKDIPFETQFLIVEGQEGSHLEGENGVVYTVFLPILEGSFRAVLQGSENDELEICLESGNGFIEFEKKKIELLIFLNLNLRRSL